LKGGEKQPRVQSEYDFSVESQARRLKGEGRLPPSPVGNPLAALPPRMAVSLWLTVASKNNFGGYASSFLKLGGGGASRNFWRLVR